MFGVVSTIRNAGSCVAAGWVSHEPVSLPTLRPLVGNQRSRPIHLPVLPDVHTDNLAPTSRPGGGGMSCEEYDEWRCAVRDLSEIDRAPYDDPTTYADTMGLEGVRWP